MKLVFLHGWAYTPRLWDPLRAELAEFETLAPRLQPATPDLLDWAETFARELPENSILVGWSLGAMLAMACALSAPSRIKGLFLIGASPRFIACADWPAALAEETVAAFKRDFARQPARTLQRFLALQLLGDTARSELKPLLECALADAAEPSLGIGLEILASSDLRARLGELALPIKLLHGAQDSLMPLAAAQFIQQQLPDAELETQACAAHAVLLAKPAELAARIREFVHAC